MRAFALFGALIVSAAAHAGDIDPAAPSGWEAMNLWDALPDNGGAELIPLGCETGVDVELLAAGQRNMTVRCSGSRARFGGLAQSFDATDFHGRRVRFSAQIKSERIGGRSAYFGERAISGKGGLWVRVLSERPNVPLVADTSFARGLTGSADWTDAEVVLDVPARAIAIRIGFAIEGLGQLWIRDLKFEEVSLGVPVTTAPAEPVNLELRTD